MINEISSLDELIQTLSRVTERPDQLIEDAESILLRIGRRDANRTGSKVTSSVFNSDNDTGSIGCGIGLGDRSSSCGKHVETMGTGLNSSDTDSGRLTMEHALRTHHYRIGSASAERCSSSVSDGTNFSIGGASSHSGGSGGSNYAPGLLSGRNCTGIMGSRDSSIMSVDSMGSNSVGGKVQTDFVSVSALNTNAFESDEVQFKTLCRPSHYRAASSGDTDIHKPAYYDSNRSESVSLQQTPLLISHSSTSQVMKSQSDTIPGTTEEDENEDDDEEEEYDDKQDTENTLEDEGGEYVQVEGGGPTAEAQPLTNSSPRLDFARMSNVLNHRVSTATSGGPRVNGTVEEPMNQTSGRHTISSAYERGPHSQGRPHLNALSFNPPVGKASSKDSGVDSSTVLYPKQAVPPPVYTNLNQLAHAAQRKFSMSQLPCTNSYTLNTTTVTKSGNSNEFIMRQFSDPDSPLVPSSMVQSTLIGSGRLSIANHHPSPPSSNAPNTTGSLSRLPLVGLDSTDQFKPFNDQQTKRNSQLSNSMVPNNFAEASSINGSRHVVDLVPKQQSMDIPNSNGGIDPFSVEMEELDRVAAGSSRASSVTIGSSATNESLASMNGSPGSNNHNGNGRKPNNVASGSYPMDCQSASNLATQNQSPNGRSHYADRTIINRTQPPGLANDHSGPSQQAEEQIYKSSQGYKRISSTTGTPNTYDSNEAANLMFELSSQLQQLAKRSDDFTSSTQPPNVRRSSSDEFVLPPPPPIQPAAECNNTSTTTTKNINTNNSNNTVAPILAEDNDSQNDSPLLAALKRSVEQRAARLAARENPS